jgi:hypothetical protein
MAKGENTLLYVFLLVGGLFYVYYRHEQTTAGGTAPPGSAPPGKGAIASVMDFLGGLGTAASAGAPTAAGGGGGGAPDVCNHLSAQQMQSPYYQQLCHTDFGHWLQGRQSVHPVAATHHPGVTNPYAQWQGIMAPPGGGTAQAHFGCASCPGSRIGTWFDEGEPDPEMEVLPRYESYGNVGSLY